MPASPSTHRRDALIAAAAALVLSTAVAIIPVVRLHEAAILSAKESLRTVIDEYTFDKKKAPLTLQDLVDQGYLRKIPVDPLTGSDHTWSIVKEDDYSRVGSEPGISDIHSGSSQSSTEGPPYSHW
jgi:general secretion pathway protein G